MLNQTRLPLIKRHMFVTGITQMQSNLLFGMLGLEAFSSPEMCLNPKYENAGVFKFVTYILYLSILLHCIVQ
jgi:hypothetical protein